ncbi:MAG: rubrerythrin family protein [Desulfovibrionales bacterium]|nr:rubrerythrin family protein [Desulfovibrionales bacterium]
MGEFRKTKTALNLHTSFAAEAQARTRYNFFANRARDEGYVQIGKLFDEIADQEMEHALRFFKFFNGGELPVNWLFPSGVIEDTRSNLLSSADLEAHVGGEMYTRFAEIALEEGLTRAADTFSSIMVSEKHHEALFRDLASKMEAGRLYHREEEVRWRCLGCGYIHQGRTAPDRCPACVRPRDYFEHIHEL